MQSEKYDDPVWTPDVFTNYLSTVELTGTARNILLELSRTAGRYNRSDLGWTNRLMNNIATRVGVGRRQVARIVAKLKQLGEIEVVYRKVDKDRNKSNEFRLSGFLRWLDSHNSKRSSGSECHPVGDIDVNHTKESLPKSPIVNDRRWDVPKSGSVKNTPLEQTIKENLPYEDVCVDYVMNDFRKCVADDRNPVTLHRLKRYCQKFKVFGRKAKKKAIPPPQMQKISNAAKPKRRGDEWDNVTQQFYAANPAKWKIWIAPLDVRAQQGGFDVVAPTAYHAAYVRNNFQHLIEDILGTRLNVTSSV